MILRKVGWEDRLSAVFAAAQRAPLEWGRNDCLLFAAAAVDALLGTGYAATWRGRYADEAGALAAAGEFLGIFGGLSQVMGAAADRTAVEIGARPVSVTMLHRGDIGIVPAQAHETFAVVDETARRLATVSPSGVVRLPLSLATRLWAVGR